MKLNPLLRRTALLCTLATGGALAVAPPAQAQFSKISEQQEIDAGRQARAQAEKEYGRALSQNDARQQRVTRIGALFARSASRRAIPYSYTVLQNDKVLNAFAAPGGPIFVTTKLMSTVSNDAELAFVLGHETGHIEHRDVVKAVEKQQQVGLGVGILGAILGGRGGGNVVGTLTGVGFTLWQKGYSRDQESEADDYGVHAMSRLGFDPRAAVSMMGKLGDGGNGIGKYLSDHPTSDARVKKMTEIIRKDNLLQVAQKDGGAMLNLSGSGGNYGNGNYNNGDVYPTNNNYPTNNGNYSNAPRPSNTAPNPMPQTGNRTIGVRMVQDGQYRVVLASANDMARYAGGTVERRGRDLVVSRGSSYVVFTPGAKTANVNGRRVNISAPMQQSGNDYFAPIATLADGLNGSATYDGNRRGVRLDFENGPSAFLDL